MSKEEAYTPKSQLKALGLGFTTAQFCYTVQRILESGMPTAGMTYCGLHDSAAAAEAARQNHNIIDKHGATNITVKEWLDSTEVVELAENEEYTPHGYSAKIHCVNDGATH